MKTRTQYEQNAGSVAGKMLAIAGVIGLPGSHPRGLGFVGGNLDRRVRTLTTMVIAVVVLMCMSGARLFAENASVSILDAGGSIGASAVDAMKGSASWKKAAIAHKFRGDCVLMNDKIAVVFSKKTGFAELLSNMSGSWKSRAKFAPGGFSAGNISRISVVSSGEDAASVEVEIRAQAKVSSIVCELKPSQVFVRTTPGANATDLRIESPARFGVVPDFFSDDVSIDANRIPVASLSVPSETIYMHAGVGGDALLTYFWSGGQEVEETIEGNEGGKLLAATTIRYLDKNPYITIAVLDAPNSCVAAPYEALKKGTFHVKFQDEAWSSKEKKLVTTVVDEDRTTYVLPWKMPYIAQWRVNYLANKDAGSDDVNPAFGLDFQQRTRQFIYTMDKGKSWKQWRFAKEVQGYVFPKDASAEVRKGFPWIPAMVVAYGERGRWPCWVSDETNEGIILPIKESYAVVVYPFDRNTQTSLDAITFTDLMRDIVGIGPCEYVLKASGGDLHGMAACLAIAQIENMAGRIKENRAEIGNIVDKVNVFFQYCKDRTLLYEKTKKELLDLLEPLKNDKELAPAVDRVLSLVKRLRGSNTIGTGKIADLLTAWETNFSAIKESVRVENPDEPELCKKRKVLLEQMRRNAAIEITVEVNYIVVKQIRSQAGIEATLDPKFKETAKKIRAIVAETMKNPEWHEVKNVVR